VSQAGAVSWLALRELWMSFRMLVVLGVTVLAGVVVALLPAPIPVLMQRFAIGLGVAAAVAGAVAAWSMAAERRRGRAAWLVARTVPRSTFLSGWFLALGSVAVAGHVGSALLAWLAASTVALHLDVATFAAAIVATLATTLAVLALGMLAGVALPAPLAVALTMVAAAVLAAAPFATEVDVGWLPGAGSLAVLAAYRDGASLGAALFAAGVALATAALLLVAARIAIERVDL
jgi:hypothetical protein